MADYIPGRNPCRLFVHLDVEGEPFRLAPSGHHLVHRRHRGMILCCDFGGGFAAAQIALLARGEGHEPREDCWFLFSVTSREQKA